MSRFIQSLEPRTLLSAAPVTKPMLLADRAAILAEAKTAKAGLIAFNSTVVANTKVVQADLKGSARTNAPLLHTLRVDEGKAHGLIAKDLHSLLGPAIGVANRSVAQGVALIAHSNTALQTRIAADLAALSTVTIAPLAKLEADVHSAAVGADLQALLLANATNTKLAADVSTLQADVSTAVSTLTTAAVSFQGGVGTVATDVAAAPPGAGGSTGSHRPNLVGSYSGSAKATTGNHVGRVSTLQFSFTSEGTDGTLSGSAIVTDPTQQPITLSVTGTVAANGTFTATLVDSSGQNNGATLHGHATATTISGTYQSTNESGTYSVSKT